MQDAIEAGTILIQKDTLMPDSLLPQGEPYSSGWVSVGRLDRPGLEMSIHKAGRTFFYLAGEVKATVFGFDEQKAVRTAVKRLIANVKTQRFNCLEITRVAMSSFLGVPYATVAGHVRHIQEGMVLSRATTPPDRAGSSPVAEVKAALNHEESEPMEVVV